MSWFESVVNWVKGWKLFPNLKKFIANTAVAATEAVKNATDPAGLLQGLAKVIDDVLNTHLAEEGVQLAQSLAVKALAVELAIEGLPDNPTPDDILAFENRVFTAIIGKSTYGKSQFLTSYAANLYGIITQVLGLQNTSTFAKVAMIVEEAYQAYQQDLANEQANQQPVDPTTAP